MAREPSLSFLITTVTKPLVIYQEEPMDAQQTEGFAKGWIQAWNQRDLEAVLSHYTEDIEFQSPLVIKLLSETSGTVRGNRICGSISERRWRPFRETSRIELLGAYQGVN